MNTEHGGELTFGGKGIKIWWRRFFQVEGNEQIFGWLITVYGIRLIELGVMMYKS